MFYVAKNMPMFASQQFTLDFILVYLHVKLSFFPYIPGTVEYANKKSASTGILYLGLASVSRVSFEGPESV